MEKLKEFATRMGVSPQAVRKAINDGRLKNSVTRGRRGWLVDPDIGKREWKGNTDPSQQRDAAAIRTGKAIASGKEITPTGAGTPNYSRARAIGESYKAKLLELEFKERSGQLISADEASLAQFKVARLFRDAVQNIPVRVVSELAAIVGKISPDKRHEMMLVMQREIDRTLTQIADSDGPK